MTSSSYTVRWNDLDYTITASDPVAAALEWAQNYYWQDENVEIVVSTETEVFLVEIAKVGET